MIQLYSPHNYCCNFYYTKVFKLLITKIIMLHENRERENLAYKKIFENFK